VEENVVERWVTVRTPEAVAFSYELAGLGSRFLALLVDSVIQGIAAMALFIGVAAAAQRMHFTAAALHLNAKTFESTVVAVAILLFFTIFYGYFVFFEKIWNGQTPGKRALGIRVVRDGGYPVELMDSMESMSHGWWRPSPGSIYPILESMAKEGVVERNGDGKYELTKAGKEEMDGSSRFRDQPPRTVEDVLEQMSGYVSYLEDIVQSEGDKMKKNAATLRQLSDRIRRLGGEGE
jgi:DNA-binding PadR family transcriptional regulator